MLLRNKVGRKIYYCSTNIFSSNSTDTTDFSPAELDKDETETEAREEMAGEEDEGREGEVPATDSSGVELVPEELVEGDGEGKEEESDRETSLGT